MSATISKPALSAAAPSPPPRTRAVSPLAVWLSVAAVAVLLIAAAWASDCVTLEGERTVFSAECRDGVWQGSRCHGELAAGERLRYRALKAHHEVVFWRVGAADPSAKFEACAIDDGRNWSCTPNTDSARSFTQEMRRGVPVASPGAPNLSYHAISKWRWWLLHLGLPAGSSANN